MKSIEVAKLIPVSMLVLEIFATTFASQMAIGADMNIEINAEQEGRVFEGIGAVSAGASTRNLVDYPEPQRGEVLDFLFRPKFGAGLQHLKVEVGGGENSTCGSEPSHAISREELKTPKSRGYEFWLMAEARKRNPRIMLDCLAWTYPNWVKSPFSQNQADWLVSFLDVARTQYGLEIDWLSAGWNEKWMGAHGWISKFLRPTLDAAGYAKVKLHMPDGDRGHDYKIHWDALQQNPQLDQIIHAVGYHYLSHREETDNRFGPLPGEREKATGKPIWASEEYSLSAKSWENALKLAHWINRVYIRDRATKFEVWCPVNSIYPGINYAGTGLMGADSPWSGNYDVWPGIWTVAHTTQFAEPGWRYMDKACGYLTTAGTNAKKYALGNYVTLRDPVGGDWSLIIQTANDSQNVSVRVADNLKQGAVHVWKSDASQQFEKLNDIQTRDGVFSVALDKNAVYSLTTTTGQTKGEHPVPPSATPFPVPFTEDFNGYAVGTTPKYFSDQKGSFETAFASDGRLCLKQILSSEGVLWQGPTLAQTLPFTLFGDQEWTDYAVQADVLVDGGEVAIGGRHENRQGGVRWSSGYALSLDRDGNWSLTVRAAYNQKERKGGEKKVLAAGKLEPFNPSIWHTLKLTFIGPKIAAAITGKQVAEIEDANYPKGRVYLASSYDPNCFTSIKVTPFPSGNAVVNLTIRADRLEGQIPDRVYGQFLEHIYNACNGGLWGELVWNRSFEHSEEKPEAKAVDNNPNAVPAAKPVEETPFCAPFWKVVGQATGAVVTNQPFNSRQCLKLTTSGAGMGIQQDRFAVRQDETYRGSIWLRGQCEKGLECRLVAGERVLASQTLAAPSSDWAEVVLVLKPSESAKNASLQILAKGEAECWLDQVSLMSDSARAVGGFRPDLLEAGKALKPPLIRWPGGGYASAYRWKDGIGPQSKRVSQMRPMWGDTDVNSLGTDEFIDYCRRVGAQPLMVFNLGLWRRKPADDAVLLNEALEWIEYCNGSTNTPMGALRVANGHSQPYNVQYWELANEWYWTGSSSALYIDRAAEFSAAIRKRYPDLSITACGSNGYKMETDHEKAMLARIGAQVQTVSLHRYERVGSYDKAPATWSGYLDAFVAAAGAAGHPTVQVYASEWNGHSVDWDNGLLAARLLLLFERRSDVVWGAAPALFYRHVSGANYNNALINFDHTGWFPGANYVVMKLFRDHYASERLSITGELNPVEAVATKSLDGKSICIKLVNPESHSVRVRISVSGMARVPEPGAVLIAPGNLQSKASLADPDAIRVVPVALDREGDISVLEMPPWSVGVVDWCPRVKSHGHGCNPSSTSSITRPGPARARRSVTGAPRYSLPTRTVSPAVWTPSAAAVPPTPCVSPRIPFSVTRRCGVTHGNFGRRAALRSIFPAIGIIPRTR